MNGNVNTAGELDSKVGDDPLVAILADMGDALTGFDTECNEGGGEAVDVGCYIVPGAPVVLAVAFDAEGGLRAIRGDPARKQFDDGRCLEQHALALCQLRRPEPTRAVL